MTAPNGCNGSCCAVFNYSSSHAELRDPEHLKLIHDGEMLADMLIPLTVTEAQERAKQFGSPLELSDDTNQADYLYMCRHWDEDTRLCGVYDSRPRMCAEFPYADPCPACEYVPSDDVIAHYVESRQQRAIRMEVEA
jgi:Fe-S-cluster containining protein